MSSALTVGDVGLPAEAADALGRVFNGSQNAHGLTLIERCGVVILK
jgi:hypothetical protein